ncbi:YmaF family protein [Bacillus weihaiensis]|uniref:YmaF family protein n=1 Tax=Bacillus weihaiensis TaxID=1547283 RepID=UPI002356DA88|nr:YmaF family protein [Bacillus weihaiensis]
MLIPIGTVKPHHSHRFFARTTLVKGHYHYIEGFTKTVNGNGLDRHVHAFQGITSNQGKHYHRFYSVTGPAIPLEDGGHYHEISDRIYYNYDEPLELLYGGVLYAANERPKHDHQFKGITYEAVGYDPYYERIFS